MPQLRQGRAARRPFRRDGGPAHRPPSLPADAFEAPHRDRKGPVGRTRPQGRAAVAVLADAAAPIRQRRRTGALLSLSVGQVTPLARIYLTRLDDISERNGSPLGNVFSLGPACIIHYIFLSTLPSCLYTKMYMYVFVLFLSRDRTGADSTCPFQRHVYSLYSLPPPLVQKRRSSLSPLSYPHVLAYSERYQHVQIASASSLCPAFVDQHLPPSFRPPLHMHVSAVAGTRTSLPFSAASLPEGTLSKKFSSFPPFSSFPFSQARNLLANTSVRSPRSLVVTVDELEREIFTCRESGALRRVGYKSEARVFSLALVAQLLFLLLGGDVLERERGGL